MLPASASAHTSGAAPASTANYSNRLNPDPARGVVLRDLRRAERGPCANGFVVESAGAPDRCSHGPDPAPHGVDVRQRPSLGELRARSDSSSSAVPCIGNGDSGDRIEVIYAVSTNRTDRYDQVAPLIAQWASEMATNVEDSATETGGFRTLRFLTAGCQLVVRHVTLSAAGDDSLGNTASELEAIGYNRADRDYLVFADATVYCGIGYVSWRFARVDSGCWGSHAGLHEVMHNLGAVQLSAPNTSGGWHCTDESDVMCYSDEPKYPPMRQICPSWHELLLDCGHDDYFSTAAPAGSFLSLNPFLNSADSSFMAERDGNQPVFLPWAPFDYRGPHYSLRIHNVDDAFCAFGIRPSSEQRVRIFCQEFRGDREADITGALVAISEGADSVRLYLRGLERGGGWAYGVTLEKDGTVLLDEEDGIAGSLSAQNTPLGGTDPETGARLFAEQTIELSLASPPLPPPPPPPEPDPTPSHDPVLPSSSFAASTFTCSRVPHVRWVRTVKWKRRNGSWQRVRRWRRKVTYTTHCQ